MKSCIASFYMGNVDMKTVGLQRSVVEKYNKSKVPFHQIKLDGMKHANGIDYFWGVNGVVIDNFSHMTIERECDYDVVMFLDIDCIPLNENSIDSYLQKAADGYLIGNAQRSNHIQNEQHMFAAPSALAISRETFIRIGKPSALETKRSDVAEEYTFKAEEAGVPIELLLPKSFDAPPFRYAWEGAQPGYWALADGYPVYGIGTTFGDEEVEFYHNFQIFTPGQQERFWARCEKELTK